MNACTTRNRKEQRQQSDIGACQYNNSIEEREKDRPNYVEGGAAPAAEAGPSDCADVEAEDDCCWPSSPGSMAMRLSVAIWLCSSASMAGRYSPASRWRPTNSAA